MEGGDAELPEIMRLSDIAPASVPGMLRTVREGELTLGLSPATLDGDLDRQVGLTQSAEWASGDGGGPS